MRKARIAVFVSGNGTNLQSLIDRSKSGFIPGKIAFVFSSRPDAFALTRAKNAGIETMFLNRKRYKSNGAYCARILKEVKKRKIDLICLAGFLLKIEGDLLREYRGRILNIHPALLPQFGGKEMYGLRVHRRVLASGAKFSGCTVHFVDKKYDHGEIILQKVVPVKAGDTPETLQARVLKEEHKLYPAAVRKWIKLNFEIGGKNG